MSEFSGTGPMMLGPRIIAKFILRPLLQGKDVPIYENGEKEIFIHNCPVTNWKVYLIRRLDFYGIDSSIGGKCPKR